MIIYDKEQIVAWLTEISLRPCDFSRPEDFDDNMTEDLANGALELLKTQVPKKVLEFDDFECPTCKQHIAERMSDGTIILETPGDDTPNYCPFCGQALDWELD